VKKLLLTGSLSVSAILASVSLAVAGPSDDSLIIDDELEMITRAAPVEGHPLSEVISGWHFRTPERNLEYR